MRQRQKPPRFARNVFFTSAVRQSVPSAQQIPHWPDILNFVWTNHMCFIVFVKKLSKTHASLSNSMQFWGYWRFMLIRQRMFNRTNTQHINYAFHSRQNSETFDELHAFLSLVVAKLSDLKNSLGFWPTLYISIAIWQNKCFTVMGGQQRQERHHRVLSVSTTQPADNM